MPDKSLKINDFLRGQILTYCYMVKRGKPAAAVLIQKRYSKEVTKLVSQEGLDSYLTSVNKKWNSLWIYKHSHILEIIKELQQTDKTKFSHWALGKLFGYTEQEIGSFLSSQF